MPALRDPSTPTTLGTPLGPPPLPDVIDPRLLATVSGGFLPALIGAIGPIMSGVSGIIGAAKSGKGGGGGGGAPPGGGGGPAPEGPPPGAAAARSAAAPGVPGDGGDNVSISININGVAVR